ncbi:sensor histidine kinase [Eubacterium sp.]|uniref:cache domain-containing sensor histidine kinase n=1 Tax=Eubacterium sp. TaxID=142586 RepID=UPI001D513AC3|nr:histidine kinase [Eubacterium sp.]MBS5620509.1 histidine kinase [Eubacterium sp.]
MTINKEKTNNVNITEITKAGKAHTHRKKIKTQVTALITITIVVALLVSGILLSYKTAKEFTKSYQEQMLQEGRSTIDAISNNIDIIDSVYRILTLNDSVYKWLEKNYEYDANSSVVLKQMTSVLIMNNIWEKSYINSIYVYNNQGSQIHVSKDESVLSTTETTTIYRTYNEETPTLTIRSLDNSNCLYFIRSIYSSDSGEILGTVIISIDKKEWLADLTQSISNGWHIFLYNKDVELISGTDGNTTKHEMNALKNSIIKNSDWVFFDTTFKDNSYLALSNNIEKMELNTVVMAPKAQISKQLFNVLLPYIVVIILIIVAVTIIAFLFSRVITRPITVMKGYVDRIADGNYSEHISSLDDYEEFYSLQLSVNNMLSEIHSYHDDILEQNMLLKDAEIRALQSQINPHFLFNVLNTMAWKAQMSDNNEIYSMAIALGELLKATVISRDNFEATVEDELSYVRFYNYLQKMRFEDKIQVFFDIEPNLDKCHIPIFSIQTLVENAYVHGLEPKETSGTLTISIKKISDNVCISVVDDGVGFTKIPTFDTNETQDVQVGGHTHVGLKNLNRRLFLMYGENSSLHIESIPMEKTTISFMVPFNFEDTTL